VTCAFVADGACTVASLTAKQGSSMTHGDADENDDVLACASTAAIAEHGQASRAIWILGASGRAGRVIAAELGVAARLARGERAPTGRLRARCALTGPELAMEAGGEFVLESAVAGEAIEWVAYFYTWHFSDMPRRFDDVRC
jgi:hypothetical protein